MFGVPTVQQVWESHETCQDSKFMSGSFYTSNIKRMWLLIVKKFNPNLGPFRCVLKIIMQHVTDIFSKLPLIIIMQSNLMFCWEILKLIKLNLNMLSFQALPQIILKRFRLLGAVAETFSRSLLPIPLSGKNTRKQMHIIYTSSRVCSYWVLHCTHIPGYSVASRYWKCFEPNMWFSSLSSCIQCNGGEKWRGR